MLEGTDEHHRQVRNGTQFIMPVSIWNFIKENSLIKMKQVATYD